ncbi:MAG: ROK family protein [Planctomycetes bacterium]|nr:ROK family protein [Planctomycetota bacterium]
MYLGIEIGGTKLQLGVGTGRGDPLAALERLDVEPDDGARGILGKIRRAADPLIQRHDVRAVGIGFGGPVDATEGRVITSHQVDGWERFSLAAWCQKTLGLPARLGNDSDLAGLAEARFGAGRAGRIVFYSNIGSGIGGALVLNGELYAGSSGVACELGHLRPGLQSDRPDQTVESLASGWAIAAAAGARLADPISHPLEPWLDKGGRLGAESVRQRLIEQEESDQPHAVDLLSRCDGRPGQLTAKMVAQAALTGNTIAADVFRHAVQVLGWALAQMINLLSPDVVVIGGGVSLVGESLLLAPLREEVRRYTFPPLDGTYQIVLAELGEEVVVHGALALAAS